MKNKWLAAALALLLTYTASASVPLGGVRKTASGKMDLYGCMFNNDYYIVNFAAFQVDIKEVRRNKTLPTPECVNLPKTGATSITIDVLDRDVRQKPVWLTLLTGDGQVLTQSQPTVAKSGIVSIQTDFPRAGNYQLVLSVDDADLNTPPAVSALHIPLTVGIVTIDPTAQQTLYGFLGLLAAIIAALAVLLPKWLRMPEPQAN